MNQMMHFWNSKNINEGVMKVILKTRTDGNVTINESKPHHDISIKEMFESVLNEKLDYSSEDVIWKNNNRVELKNFPANKLHSFLLEAESFGLKYSFDRSTIITLK